MFGWIWKKKDNQQEAEIPPEEEVNEKELEEKGFDPVEAVPDIPSKEEAITDFNKYYAGYLDIPKEDILKQVAQ